MDLTSDLDMEVKLEYVSVGCNRTPHSVDWAPSGLLAYGADRSIALARESRVSLQNCDEFSLNFDWYD